MKKIKLLLAILALLVPIAVSAQSKKSFERAMKEPRSFGKAYFLCKDSRGRPEEYMSKAEKYGYVITPSDNRFMVYFVPKSEYEVNLATSFRSIVMDRRLLRTVDWTLYWIVTVIS